MSSKILDCPECHHRFNFEYENELPDSISCPGCGKTSPKDEYSALVICHSCRTKLRIPLDILYDPDNSCPKCGVKLDPQTLFSETNVESTFTGHAADQHKLYKRLLQDGELFDKFRIVRLLGKGGMAEVYLAEHLLLNKLCALKLMRSNVASDDAVFVKRFLREAKLTNSITHPNIVKVFDVGNDFKSGTLFIAMEYVEGKTLLQLMKEKTLSEEELKSILVSMTNALQALYDAQIVHRDIKPSNIMLDNDGVLKLMDLGIAKFSGNKQEGEMTLTMEQASIGTPSYASPEQCRSAHSADIRSDIYCLGATLYHLASGKLPFEGSTPVETILQVLDKEPEPLKDLRPDLSKKMLNLIGRMMMKNPDERPANPDALLAMVYGAKDNFNGNFMQKLLYKMWQPLKNFIIPPKEERTVAKLFARTVKLFVAVVSIFVALYALNHIYEQREAMDAKKRAVEEAKKPKPFDPTQNKQSMVTYPTVTVGSRYVQQQARFPLVKVKRPSGTVLEYDKPEQFISPEDNTTVVWQIKDGILEYDRNAAGKGNVHNTLSKHLKAPDMRLYSHWAVSVDFQINSINDGLLFNLSDFGVYAFNKRLLITEGKNYVRTDLTLEPDKWMNLTLSLDRKMRKFTILSGDRLLGCYVFPQHSFGIGEMKVFRSEGNLRIKIDRIRFYKSPIDFTVPDKIVHEPVLFSSERLSAAATDSAAAPAAKTDPAQYDGVWMTDYQAAREKAKRENKWLLIFVSVEEEKPYFFDPMQRHLNSNSAGAVLCRKELSRYVPVRVFVSRDELPQLTWKEKLDLPEVPQKYRSPEEAMSSRVTGRGFKYVPMMFAVSPDWTRTAALHWNSTRPYAISERLSLINQQVIDSGDTSNTYGDYVKRQSTYSSASGNAPADWVNILVYRQVFSPQNNYKNKPVWVFAGKDQQEIDALQNAARDALAGSGEKPLVMHIDCSNTQDEFLQLARKRIFGDNNTLPAVALLGINREVSFLEYGITPEKITDFCKTSLSEYQKEAEVVFAPGVRTAKRRLQECRLRLARLQKLPVTELRKAQIDYVQKQIIELNKLINMEIARKNARYSATATRNFQKKLQSYCLTGQGALHHDSRRDHLVQQRKEILQLLRNPAVDPNCTVSIKNYKGEMQQLSLLAIALGNGFMESREEFKKILLSRNPDPDSAKRPNSIERYCLGQDIASDSSAGRVFARKLLNADNKLIVGNYYDSSDFKKYMLLNPGIHYYGSGNLMMIATEIDSADVANELILSGYNYGYETVMGATPWRTALKHGSKSVVNLLKKYYFNTEESSQVRRQYEFCEAMRRKDYAAVEEYISQGADINQVWENGLNALQNACIINDVKLVKLLRKNGADPAAFEELRRFRVISNPLQIAVSKNNPELFAELCNSNIDKKAMVPGFNNISNMPLSAFIIQMAKYTKDDSTAIAMLKTIDRYGGDGSTPRRLLTRLSNTFRPQENSRVQYNILNYLLHNRKVSQADIGYVINGVWNRDCRNLLARSRRTDR